MKESVVQRTPIKVKESRLKSEEVMLFLTALKISLLNHIGKSAILFVKESKGMVPYVVRIENYSKDSDTLVGRYYVSTNEGNSIEQFTHFLSPEKLMTGEQKLMYIQ